MRIARGVAIGNGVIHVASFTEEIDLDSNRLILLRGPNGSGKTTLLKTLQGLVRYRGKEALPALAHQAIYLPERLDWADHLSFSAALQDLCAPAWREIFAALAEKLQLPSKSIYSILSKGNRQKMSVILTEAIARSRRLKWVLLDEPLSGLDPASQETLIDFWNQARTEHRVISSHGDLRRFASPLILQLEQGSIQTFREGLPSEAAVARDN